MVIFNSQVRAGGPDYLQLREETVAAASERLPPPLRRSSVLRRQGRLELLRRAAAPRGGPLGEVGECLPCPPAALQELAAQLRGRGFAVASHFRGRAAARALRAGLEALPMRSGVMSGATQRSLLRGDEIAWPDAKKEGDTPFGSSLRSWLQELDRLVASLRPLLALAGELQGVTAREPCMASCYPPGAGYIRHYDNNCEDGLGDCNGRRLTAVYYLNEGAVDAHWGHLRLASQRGGVFDVLPAADVLVLFWADRRTPHEVLPNRGPKRYALSCWYVDTTEGPEADVEPMGVW